MWHQKVELVQFCESLVQKKRKEGKIKLEFRGAEVSLYGNDAEVFCLRAA